MRLWMTDMRDFSKTLWCKTKPTRAQTEVAKQLEIKLPTEDSFLVASARIIDAIAESIGDTPRHEPTKIQIELATQLGIDISDDSRRVAWAKIKQTKQQAHYEGSVAAIEHMQLGPGDVVTWRRVIYSPDGKGMEFECQGTISTIRWDGLVYFKDGRFGNEIFLLEPGNLIFPNYHQAILNKERHKGMHGYHPGHISMKGIFTITGGVKSRLEDIEVVDIVPSLLNLMGLMPPEYMRGRIIWEK